MSQDITRTQEIRQIHREYGTFYRIAGGIGLVLFGVMIGAGMFSGNAPIIRDSYLTNLYTEGMSVLLTIVVLNYLAERRDTMRREMEIKEQLLRDAASTVNATARSSVDQTRKRDWHTGENALLRRADLREANLENTDLREFDLSGVDFRRANLSYARMRYAQLKDCDFRRAWMHAVNLIETDLRDSQLRLAKLDEARLGSADLSGLDLTNTTLEKARLTNSKLRGTQLFEADLRGADLRAADLTDADLRRTRMDGVVCNEKTILPDGRAWSTETDWRTFGALVDEG